MKSFFLTLALSAHAFAQEPVFELGQLAPESGLTAWLEPESDSDGSKDSDIDISGRPGERASRMKAGERGELGAYRGIPLVLHTLAWDDAISTGEMLPLMRDLVNANVDRGIAVIGIANTAGEDALADELKERKRHALPYPVAREILATSGSPYVDLAGHGLAHAFVIGPNGALLWRGNPIEKEGEFVEAVQIAYARPTVESLTAPLHAELKKAVAAYLAADLKDARSKAMKLTRSKDAEVSAGATSLVELVDTTLASWLQEARKHGNSGPDLLFFKTAQAIRTSAPRSDTEKELDALEKDLKKKAFWRVRAQDLSNWLELVPDRPALFPARVTKPGNSFAKQLGKFRRSTTNSNEATQSAEDMLKRYEAAKALAD